MNSYYLQVDETIWSERIEALSFDGGELLERVRAALSLVADLSRSDVFILLPKDDDHFVAALHARPHSMATLYPESPAGRRYASTERPWLWAALTHGVHRERVEPEVQDQRSEMWQQVWPILDRRRRPLGAMALYTNVIERERHKRRDPAFQQALVRLLHMAAAGQVEGTENLPPFLEQDGILFVDHLARYRYLSGQANNLYRRLGYLDDLRGRTLDEVAAGDLELVQKAWENQACEFMENTVRGRALQRSAVPLLGRPDLTRWERLAGRGRQYQRYGALLLVKDVTEEIATASELKVKAAMIKEVHHRVKNNLQLLVSIMRMQSRRAFTEEARELLHESMNRVLSMSAIHETLSEKGDQALNLADVMQRLLPHLWQSAVGPAKDIHLVLTHADDVILPTHKATACALIVNELILNAIKYGHSEQTQGQVAVEIYDRGDAVELQVLDNGPGLPADFSLESETSLGLDIVRTLVQHDLKGTFALIRRPEGGTQAMVCFPKGIVGGPS